MEIVADVIVNGVEGVFELSLPEERFAEIAKQVESFIKEEQKILQKRETLLNSIVGNINHKVFIPYLPKLTIGKYSYQLKPLNGNIKEVEQPYILIKSYKKDSPEFPRSELNSEYKDCSGCSPEVVQYCKNCGRILVDGKHPPKFEHHQEDHGVSPPSISLKRELIYKIYTDIAPFVFIATFITCIFGAEGIWESGEEKMSFLIGHVANKFTEFKENLSEELQRFLGI